MTKQLNEYNQNTLWIQQLSKEEQHEWYLTIKESLPLWKEITNGQTDDLEMAIMDYELRNNIS